MELNKGMKFNILYKDYSNINSYLFLLYRKCVFEYAKCPLYMGYWTFVNFFIGQPLAAHKKHLLGLMKGLHFGHCLQNVLDLSHSWGPQTFKDVRPFFQKKKIHFFA
jgi:hypothetical protein